VKKTRSCAAARHKVIPAAEDFVHSAADRVGPLAQSAADRVSPLVEAAADRIGSAADKLSPLAHSAADKLSPLAHSAADAVTPYAHHAADRLTPLAASVKERGADLLHDAGELFGPRLDDAKDRVGPAVGAARDKVSDDLLPKLTEALAAAAASPLAVEVINRGRATLAAATGELALPPEKPKRRWPKRLGVIAALAGLAYVVARKFLGSKDSEWQSARPTTPYAPPKSSAPATSAAAAATTGGATTGAATTEADVPTAEHEVPGDDPQSGASAHMEYLEANGDAEPDQPVEGGDEESAEAPFNDEVVTDVTPPAHIITDFGTDDSAGSSFVANDFAAAEVPVDEAPSIGDDVAADEVYGVSDGDETETDLVYVTESGEPDADQAELDPERWSGEGAYVGNEPPEGFTIKGNERSMKYHLPDSGGYARTIAEVWFNSEEAAQAAGFVRAQR